MSQGGSVQRATKVISLPLSGRNVITALFNKEYRALNGMVTPYGYRRQFSIVAVQSAVASAENIIGLFRDPNGQLLVITASGTGFIGTTSMGAAILGPGTQADWTYYNSKNIIAGSVSTVKTVSSVGVVGNLSGSAPLACYVESLRDVVFLANQYSAGAATETSWLSYSAVSDETAWSTSRRATVGGGAGGAITGIRSFLGALYIFKNSGIWKLAWVNDPYVDGKIIEVTREFGMPLSSSTTNPRAIVMNQTMMVFPNIDGSIVTFDGSTFKRLSDGIVSGLSEASPVTLGTKLTYGSGAGDSGRIYVAGTTLIDSHNMMTGAWDQMTPGFTVTDFLTFNSYRAGLDTSHNAYFGASNGVVYKMSDTSVATSYTLSFNTGLNDFDNPTSDKQIRSIYIDVSTGDSSIGTNNPTMTVTITDEKGNATGAGYVQTASINFSSGYRTYRLDFAPAQSKMYKVAVSIPTTNPTISIQRVLVMYEEMGGGMGPNKA